MVNLLPKKANIDLKRGLGLKIDRLNAKTERAIVEILSKNHCHSFVLPNLFECRGVDRAVAGLGDHKMMKLYSNN